MIPSLPIKQGIPQRSVLGPLPSAFHYLLIIYQTWHMASKIMKYTVVSFLYARTNTDSFRQVKLPQFFTFYAWIMLKQPFHRHCIAYLRKYKNCVKYGVINELKWPKLLWFIIDNNLSWEKHRDKISRKIKYCLFINNRLVKIPVLYPEDIGLIYLSLTYGMTVWRQLKKLHLYLLFRRKLFNKLQDLNRIFLRSCLELKYTKP
jgi:hypothetical protein